LNWALSIPNRLVNCSKAKPNNHLWNSGLLLVSIKELAGSKI